MNTPPHSRSTPTMSLGDLNLNGLDLINLDLDELTDIADSFQSNSKQSLSPDDAFSQARQSMAEHNACKGQRLYAESLTSDDGSSSRKSSVSSITSNSSISSNCSSNYSTGSNRSSKSKTEGKRLVTLGLAASEVVALSTLKKSAKQQRKQQLKQLQLQQQQQQQQQVATCHGGGV